MLGLWEVLYHLAQTRVCGEGKSVLSVVHRILACNRVRSGAAVISSLWNHAVPHHWYDGGTSGESSKRTLEHIEGGKE